MNVSYRRQLMASTLLMGLTFAATPALAQSNTSSTSASSSITVYQPISIVKDSDLAFGRVVRPSSGTGSVTIANNGARTPAGGVVGLTSTTSAASFTVTGEGASSVAISIPATFSMNNGTASLIVTTSNDLAAPAATILSGLLGGTGMKLFNVGGSVPIADTTVSGAYTGSFTVTATYN